MVRKRYTSLMLTAGVALAALALSAGTQSVAHSMGYPRAFGDGIADLGRHRIYAPWSIVSWSQTWGQRYPKAFASAEALAFGSFALPALMAVGLSRKRQRRSAKFGEDAWGDEADLEAAGLIDPKQRPAGRVIGSAGGKRLTYRGIEHSIVIGASRSGKGVGHVIPTALSWPDSLFVYDRKGEIWHITADHRRKFSHCFYFAPTDPNTARWNPLFEVRKGPSEIADIQNIVNILVDPEGTKAGNLSFWDQSAGQFFVGVILHVLYTAEDSDKTLAHVRALLLDIKPTLETMLSTRHRWRPDASQPDGLARDAAGERIAEVHPEIRLGATAFANMEDRVRSGVLATAQAALALFADPQVAHATSWSDFAIGDLVCSKNPVSFYLTTPQAHADRLAFLVRVMLRQSINSLMENIDRDSRGRAKRHRLLLMLDEFPKLGALPFLENALGEMAGYGITAQLFCQSFSDVFARYGVHTAIFDNMHITVAFATSEPGSIERVIKRAGRSLEYRPSYSDPRSLLDKGHRSTSLTEQERFILAEQDVRGLPANRQFVFVNGAKPFVTDKIRHFDDPVFRRMAVDFHHGEVAAFEQTPETLDVSGRPTVDWIGVRAIGGPTTPKQPTGAVASQAATDRFLFAAAGDDEDGAGGS